MRFYNGATLNGKMDFGGNLTTSGAINTTGGVTTNTLSATAAGTSITASGDIKYNGTTSLTTQMATLNGYKTSGSIAATTTFQTIFTWASGTQGFITMIGSGTATGMMCCFFEGLSGLSYPSITQLASSGQSGQASLNTSNTGAGTQSVFAQLGPGYAVQAKVSTACTLYWCVTYM